MEAVALNEVNVVQLFLENGHPDLDIKDGSGKTALDIAANQGNDELVGILLEAM